MRIAWLVISVSLLTTAGCASCPGEAPSGPGATSATDLRPWTKNAPIVTYTGRLQYFHCTSEHGNFWTWSLDPAGKDDAAEVDVRACAADANRLENRRVTVSGRLIERGVRHFPILVAGRIQAAPSTEYVRYQIALASLNRALHVIMEQWSFYRS